MYIIKGHYVTDSGTLEAGTLLVERNTDHYIDFVGGRITAKRFAVTKDISDIELTSATSSWTFIPAGGELKRIGMAVTAV